MSEYKRLKQYQVGFITENLEGLHTVERSVTEVNAEEARRYGLTILSRSTNPNKSLYRYDACGHTEFLQPTHVRRNNFRCSTCQRIKEINDASKVGYTLLHKTSGPFRKYRKSCGHLFITTTRNIEITKAEKCSYCFSESLFAVADKNGYDLCESLGNGRWIIRFKDCGHKKESHQTQIFKANCVCRECLEQEHIAVSSEQGLTYLYSTEDRYHVYRLPCGHEKELRQDHAQDGSWLCSVCGDSHYNKPSNAYIYKFTHDSFSWLKFGFAKELNLRSNNYGVPKGTTKELVSSLAFDSGYDAMLFEKSIHAKYKSIRYPKSKMQEYHAFNGFTECYPVDALDTLIKEIEDKRKQLSG